MTATTNTPPTRAARNKQIVQHAFAEFARGNVAVLDTVLHDEFVEHSPGNPSGKAAFIAFITAAPVASSRLDLKRIIADEEYVAVHYHMTPHEGGRGSAVVDIWRLEGDLIVEHWDAVQPVPAPEDTPHGMF